MISLPRRWCAYRFYLATAILFSLDHSPARAMQGYPTQLAAAGAPGSSSGKGEASRSENLLDPAEMEAKIDRLTRRVDELTQLVEILLAKTEQGGGRTIAGQERSNTDLSVRNVSAPASAEFASVAANPAEIGTGAIPAKAAASESATIAVGPFRFSGDFRLRLDGILRPSYDSPTPGQPSLPHVQNVRARYRLRFNIDTDIHPAVSFHGQLATGPMNNPLTLDQDFAATVTRHPILVNEAWVDFHPTKGIRLQGGRVQEVFADNLRFLFDDDVTFNGFNERFAHEFARPFAGLRRVELRGGQYILSHPNVAIVTQENLGPAGAVIGSTGRAAQLFHQGFVLDQGLSAKASQQFGADMQLYRNPNQIQFASTPAGVPIIVQDALGIALSGPVKGTGNATTAPGGAVYSARSFQVARLTYRLDHMGFKSGRREYPVSFNLQVSRNVGTGQPERDALLAAIKVGRIRERFDHSFLYMFGIKGANAMISQLTDDDLGTSSGVNIRAHQVRFDIGLGLGIQVQSLLFLQNELRNSGQYPGFFVPLNAFTPRQFRFQEQIVFVF